MFTFLLTCLLIAECQSSTSTPFIQTSVYSEPIFTPIPLPPSCVFTRVNDSIVTGSIKIWKLDQSKLQRVGLLYWDEDMETSCYSNIIGQTEITSIKRRQTLPVELASSHAQEILSRLDHNEVRDVQPLPTSSCAWLRTLNTSSVRHWVQKVSIQRYIDGTVVGFSGTVNTLQGKEYTLSNQYQRLFIPHENLSTCPFRAFSESPCIIRKSQSDLYITVPSSNLQFSLSIQSESPYCSLEGEDIYLTPSGFLISSPSIKIKKRYPIQQLSNVQPNLILSRVLYDVSHLESLVDTELMELERDICVVRKLLWNTASHLRSADLLAQFSDGNIFSRGFLVPSGLMVQHPLPSGLNCHIPSDRETYQGLLKVKCNNETRWILPLSSILVDKNTSVSGVFPPLVPINQEIFVHYFSGELVPGPQLSPAYLKGWKEIEMPNLYHMNELYHAAITTGDSSSPESHPLPSLSFNSLLDFSWGPWSVITIKILIGILCIYIIKELILSLICKKSRAYKTIALGSI